MNRPATVQQTRMVTVHGKEVREDIRGRKLFPTLDICCPHCGSDSIRFIHLDTVWTETQDAEPRPYIRMGFSCYDCNNGFEWSFVDDREAYSGVAIHVSEFRAEDALRD